LRRRHRPQQQAPPQQPQYQPQPQVAPQYQPQQLLEEYRQAQARLPELEKAFAERHPDYQESIARLQPGRETPIPPTAYLHTVMNVQNPADVAYHLSKSPEILAKLWSLEASGQGVKIIEEINHISSGLRFQGNTAQAGAGAATRREHRPVPAPYRSVGGASMSSSTGGYHEGMSMRDYNKWRDAGGGGGTGRR
jgi:hypothetical protein